MSHPTEFEIRAIRYADGEMDAVERETFEAHLAECERCTRMLEGHRNSMRIVRSAFRNPPEGRRLSPAHVRNRVTRHRRMRYSAVAACSVLIVGALTFRGTRDTGHEPVQDSAGSSTLVSDLDLRIALLEARLAEMQADMEFALDTRALADRLAYSETASIAFAAAIHLEESGLDLEGARSRYEFVADQFPDSPAGVEASRRLAAMTNANAARLEPLGEAI